MERRLILPVLLGLAALSAGCERIEPPQQARALIVALLDDPVFYQASGPGDQPAGFDHDLLRGFAEELQLPLKVVSAGSPAEIEALLARHKVHFAAAMAVQSPSSFRYTVPLHRTQPIVVQHADALSLEDPEDLAGRSVEALVGASEATALRQLPVTPPPLVVASPAGNAIDLLARVAERQTELAVTDSAHFQMAVNYYPDVEPAQTLPGEIAYAWAFRGEDDALRQQADDYLERMRSQGQLARLQDRYFSHMKRIDALGASQFIADMRQLLPRYRADFQRAQATTGIDWRLLAALGYQESKWDPLATSPTGVRGLMMLTEDTADRMRVGNRLDARESIMAGSRYLAELMDALPDRIGGRDRTWLALAAYNLGMGHLNGARQFAVGLKRDPTSWYEMKKVLPLLARPEYYSRLKAGRARGGEAVIMVENIRVYYDILSRFESPYQHTLIAGISSMAGMMGMGGMSAATGVGRQAGMAGMAGMTGMAGMGGPMFRPPRDKAQAEILSAPPR